ncbi:MAG: hypothetical protein PVI71_14390 [Desulfobacterales bacterium]|jgi:hypothetical protein
MAARYLSSARLLSLSVLVLTYIAWELAVFHSSRSHEFSKIRELYVLDLVINEIKTNTKIEKLEDLPKHLDACDQQKTDSGTKPPAKKEIKGFNETFENITVYQYTKEPRCLYISVESSWRTRDFHPQNTYLSDEYRNTAAELEIKLGDNLSEALRTLDDNYYRRKVKIPWIEFKAFRTESSIWIIAVLSFIIFVMIHNRIKRIMNGPDKGIGEPWLILDAQSTGEKFIAILWLSSIFFCTWIINGALLLTMTEYFKTTGRSTPWLLSSLVFFFIAFLELYTARLSLTIITCLLELRKSRNQILRDKETTS